MSRKMSAYARQKLREQSKPGAVSEALMQKVCGLDFMLARSKPFRQATERLKNQSIFD